MTEAFPRPPNRAHTVYSTLYKLMLTDNPYIVPGRSIYVATCSVLFHETEWPAFKQEAETGRIFEIYGIDRALRVMQEEHDAWAQYRNIQAAGFPQLPLPLMETK